MTNNVKHDLTFKSVLSLADKAEQVINGKKEQVAQALMGLATGLSTPGQFEVGCAAAESERKARITEMAADKGMTKDERKKLVRLPASWSNAKSVILRGWEDYKLIPNDYESFSQFKDAKEAAAKASKEGKSTTSQGEGIADNATIAMGGSVTTVLFSDLIKRISIMDTSTQEMIALELNDIIAQYEVAPTEQNNEPTEQDDAATLAALEEEQIRQATA